MPLFLGILGNVIWGFSFLMQRVAQQVSSPEIMLSVRFLIAWIILSIPLITGHKKLQLRGRNLKWFLLLGIMEPLYHFLEAYAIYYTNSAFAGVALSFSPIVSILLACLFLKEIPTRRQAVFCLLPVAGVIVITISGKELGVASTIGIIVLILSCLISGTYRTLNRKISSEFSTYERTYIVMTSCALAFFIAAAADEGGIAAYFSTVSAAVKEPAFLWPVLGMCFLSSLGAKAMVNYATGKLSVTVMSSLSSLLSLCSLIAGIVIFHEPYSVPLLIGAAMILIGVWQVVRPQKQQKTN